MAKEKKEMSVLELPLIVEPWQEKRLNNKYSNIVKIYNAMRNYEWNKVKQLHQTKMWREELSSEVLAKLHEQVKELNITKKSPAEDKKKADELNAKIKDIYNRRNDLYKELGLTEFGFTNKVARFSKPYAASVPSAAAGMSVAKPLWRAFDSCLFGKGDTPGYKKYKDTNTISTDGRSGIILKKDDKGYFLALSNMQAKAKKMAIRIKYDDTDYNNDMINRKIKVVTIVRKLEKTKYHYYVQLTVEGKPYDKMDSEGNYVHKLGEGVVGLHIWRNKLCAVADDRIAEYYLAPDLAEYQKKLEELTRGQEKIRRELNPQNFNSDGTIKKGIINEDTGVREKLTWHFSRKYKDISRKRRELQRIYKEQRKIHTNNIIYDLLSMGDSFIMPEYAFITKKEEYDEAHRLSNDEYKKKKERRKAIQEGAPAEFLAKLNNKLSYFGRDEVKRINIAEEKYWYCHIVDRCDKSLFTDDLIKLSDGRSYPHTSYRAFIIRYYNEELDKYDLDEINKHFDKYYSLV